MSKIFRATASLPPIIVLHGLPGIGKTTLAADFPAPVFVQVEDGIPGWDRDRDLRPARKLFRDDRRAAVSRHRDRTITGPWSSTASTSSSR